MPNITDAIRFGILRTRDLVELYYGARMVTKVNYTSDICALLPKQFLAANPSRIRYEMTLANFAAADREINLFGQLDDPNGNATEYTLRASESIIIIRDFLTDFEAVTLPVFAYGNAGDIEISFRETILTPAPVDEIP